MLGEPPSRNRMLIPELLGSGTPGPPSQDAVFLTGLFYKWHTDATSAAPKARQSDAAGALEDFKASKGLGDVKVEKGRSTWYVSI